MQLKKQWIESRLTQNKEKIVQQRQKQKIYINKVS